MDISEERKYRLEILFAKNEKENVIFMTSADQAFFNRNAASSAAQYHADQKVDTYNRREFFAEDKDTDDKGSNEGGSGAGSGVDEAAKAALKNARASYKMLFNKQAGNQWDVTTINQKMADEKVRMASIIEKNATDPKGGDGGTKTPVPEEGTSETPAPEKKKPTPNPSKEGNAAEVVLTKADLPKESDLKADTQKWMTDNKIPFEAKDTEPELIDKVNAWYAEKTK